MKVQIANIVKETSTDGAGLRTSIYFQGCSIRCPECHNKELWDENKGDFVEVDEVLSSFDSNFISGISILGGEPTDQPEALIELITKYKMQNPTKTIWLYTGRVYEWIKPNIPPLWEAIQQYVDVVVDGPYIGCSSAHCKFRGSQNQRIINVKVH